MITVKQLIESLQRFDENSPVEICILQYNKKYPVAYCEPNRHVIGNNKFTYAISENGKDVRMHISLPSEGDSFTYTATRKK